MKKSLSKRVTEILFLTSIGVVGYTAMDATTAYAQNVDKNLKSEATVNQDKKEEVKHILNITKIQYGKFYSDDSEYRINYKSDGKYEKCINEVLVNGKEYTKEKSQYDIHYYGMRLDPIGFTKDKNKVVIKANGYKNIELIIQKDGQLLDYKEVESDMPKLNVENNIKVEEGTLIDLNKGISASDKKDGDLKGKIEIKADGLDAKNPKIGVYKVVYRVTNSLGQTVSATRQIEVVKKNNNSNTNLNVNQKETKITNKIADGVYTLGFKAYKEENPNQESMLGGFFDKNIKVTVKNGKITFKMLNLMNADLLLDFRMESKNKYSESKSEWVGEADSQGLYFMQTFEFPVEDLLSKHTACVLVSAMGGKKSDIGNVDKYRKAKFVFDKNLKEGWNGFEVLKNQKTQEEILNKALKSAGLDTNNDGKVTDEEIAAPKTEVDLSDNKIKDISRLKNLNSQVKILKLNGNNIHELPKGVFDNLVNLEKLYLNGNKIKELPEGIFNKLSKLKILGLSTNMIQELPKGIFDKLINLEEIQLSSNKITKIDKGIFNNLINLKALGVTENKLTEIDDNAFDGLNKLEGLYLYNNKLRNIPKSIGSLKNLKALSLNDNNIAIIPKEFMSLKELKNLDLHTNFIENISKEIYNNLKEIQSLNISDNQLKEIPENISNMFPKAYNLDFSMNKITSIPKFKNNNLKVYPQKSVMNLKLYAKDGKITWNQDLPTLDMAYWAHKFYRDIPKNLAEYQNVMKDKKKNKDIKEVLNATGYDWTIITEIQKKNNEGNFITIKKIINSNDNDKSNGTFDDSEMKKGSEYKIVKKMFFNQGFADINIFNDVAIGFAENNAIKNESSINQKNKSYDIKVKILKEKENEPSMAATYIKKVSYEVKNGKHYIIAKLNRSDWMSEIKATVDGKEISPEILNKEKNSNGEETSDIKFEVKDLNSKVALGMNVQPMGNSRVSFRIVPEEESLKLVKADELKENANQKDNLEIKDTSNKTEIKKEDKENNEKAKEEIEKINKEVEKKKAELQKVNDKLEKVRQEQSNKNNNVLVENNNDNESQFYNDNKQEPIFLSHKVDMSAFSNKSNANNQNEQYQVDGFQSLSSLVTNNSSNQGQDNDSQDTSNSNEETNDSDDEYSQLAETDSVELEDLGDEKKDEPKVEETKSEKIVADKKSSVNFKVLGIIGGSILGLGAIIYGLTLKFKNKIRRGDNK